MTRRISHRTIIVDRQVAALAVEPDTLKLLPYLLVREPDLVRSICAEFAALWRGAHPVGFGADDTLADQTVRETWKC